MHSELDAISSNLCVGAILYVAGYTVNDNPICSIPCHRCRILIANSRIKSVVCLEKEHAVIMLKRQEFEIA